jgi:hypothetical protein
MQLVGQKYSWSPEIRVHTRLGSALGGASEIETPDQGRSIDDTTEQSQARRQRQQGNQTS